MEIKPSQPNLMISDLISVDKYNSRFWSMFKCQKCGKCCRTYMGTIITSTDINVLATGLRMTPREVIERFTKMIDDKIVLKQPCPFWTPDMGCAVYGIRPAVCRTFPLHNVRCTDGLPHLGVDRGCKVAVEALEVLEAEINAYVPKEISVGHFS